MWIHFICFGYWALGSMHISYSCFCVITVSVLEGFQLICILRTLAYYIYKSLWVKIKPRTELWTASKLPGSNSLSLKSDKRSFVSITCSELEELFWKVNKIIDQQSFSALHWTFCLFFRQDHQCPGLIPNEPWVKSNLQTI